MIFPQLCLYNLTLRQPQSNVKSLVGSFSGKKKSQELICATCSSIELWNLDSETGKLTRAFSQDCFSVIRNICVLRAPGTPCDLLGVTSDSGNFSVLKLEGLRFKSVSNEPCFKSGVRRLSPGEYIAVDGRNRAVMLGSIEKNKLAYIISRNEEDENHQIRISSPLEAHKQRTVTYDMCGLDVGYDNPVFAGLEKSYGNGKKHLTFYELDLGLNHVAKLHSEEVDATANLLIPIPGSLDGPSGLLMCSRNLIQYKFLSKRTHSIPIPQREGYHQEDRFIVCGVVHRLRKTFFALVQNNFGDLFKVVINQHERNSDNPGSIENLQICYFDTLPVCRNLVIFKSGFLFADCESGDKYLYQFEKLGEDSRMWSSSDYPDELACAEEEDIRFPIQPLENLGLVDIVESLNPALDAILLHSETRPTVYTACGTGARSNLRGLIMELPVSKLVSSELPADALKVFTTRTTSSDVLDRYMVLSFIDGTLVLKIGESVEEVSDLGLLLDVSTIAVQQVGVKKLAQVVSSAVLMIDSQDSSHPAQKWLPPAGVSIMTASCTNTQIALGLSNRELVYLEVDENDKLIEYQSRKEMSGQITCLSLGEIPAGRLRSPYLVVGCNDMTLRVLSVDPDSPLEILSVQALSAAPSDVVVLPMPDSSAGSPLYVHVGLQNGVYVRTLVDPRTGKLSDTRVRYLGPKQVTLSPVKLKSLNGVLAFSVKTYLAYVSGVDFKVTPLSVPMSHGSSFLSEECTENGVVSVYRNTLSINTVDRLDNDIAFESIPLRYTPKRVCCDSETAYVIEGDFNVKSPYTTNNSQEENSEEILQQFGYVCQPGMWGSCIEVISTSDNTVVQSIEMEENLAAFAITTVSFASRPDDRYVVVSASQNQSFLPNSNSGSFLLTYKTTPSGELELCHKTKTDELVLSLVAFQGKLLAGVKGTLTLYEIGLKQLLKKSTTPLANCTQITRLATQGFRVVVSDLRDSIRFVVYKSRENRFVSFIDDIMPRHTTCLEMLDYDTVVGGDRFGNVFVLRCPEKVSDLSDQDDHSDFISAGKGSFLEGSPYKFDQMCNFYLQDIATSFTRGSLTVGGKESILYTGLQGTFGLFTPVESASDIQFYVSLEQLMRSELDSYGDSLGELETTGRSHLAYRGYYTTAKGVIDGDLVEKYYLLSDDKKGKIAIKLDRTPKEVERKISEMRARVAF